MERIKVLAVEDEPAIQYYYQSIFARPAAQRFQLTLASDVPEALQALRRDAFDIVVLDWGLPGGDGASLAQALRDGEATRGVSILMVTVRSSGADTILALKSGVDDHMTKPFDGDMLLMRLNGLARRRELGKATAAEAECGSPLTILERNVLQIFLRHGPVRPTREQLCAALWSGDPKAWAPALRDVLGSLRRKMGAAWADRLKTF